jgi:hypothetical protein
VKPLHQFAFRDEAFSTLVDVLEFAGACRSAELNCRE